MKKLINQIGARIVELYMNWMLDLDIRRHSDIPAGPKILIANHPTTTDPFYMLSLVREPVHVLVAEIAFNAKGFGSYLHAAGHIPVIAGRGREAFAQARRLLDEGKTVGIFPGGSPTGMRDADGRKPATGPARLAMLTGAPVVPIGIHVDPDRIHYRQANHGNISDQARWYLRGPYAITVGAPLKVLGSVEDRAGVQTLSQRLMDRISALTEESAARAQARWGETRGGLFNKRKTSQEYNR